MLSYRQWEESTQRDVDCIIIERNAPYRVYYDRFVRAFILPDQQKVVPFEAFYEIARSR